MENVVIPQDQHTNEPAPVATGFDQKARINGIGGPLATALDAGGAVGEISNKGGRERVKISHRKRSSVVKICEICGAEYHPWVERILESKYCSKNCRSLGNIKPGGMPRQRTDRRIAHDLVQAAVKSGAIQKPNKCQRCGTAVDDPRNMDGHHKDYSKPFDVEWLCRKCHVPIGLGISEEILAAAIRKASEKTNGKVISLQKMQSLSGQSPGVYKKRYGSWKKAKEHFGVL